MVKGTGRALKVASSLPNVVASCCNKEWENALVGTAFMLGGGIMGEVCASAENAVKSGTSEVSELARNVRKGGKIQVPAKGGLRTK